MSYHRRRVIKLTGALRHQIVQLERREQGIDNPENSTEGDEFGVIP